MREKSELPREDRIPSYYPVPVVLKNESDGILIRREKLQNILIVETHYCMMSKPIVRSKLM